MLRGNWAANQPQNLRSSQEVDPHSKFLIPGSGKSFLDPNQKSSQEETPAQRSTPISNPHPKVRLAIPGPRQEALAQRSIPTPKSESSPQGQAIHPWPRTRNPRVEVDPHPKSSSRGQAIHPWSQTRNPPAEVDPHSKTSRAPKGSQVVNSPSHDTSRTHNCISQKKKLDWNLPCKWDCAVPLTRLKLKLPNATWVAPYLPCKVG